MNRLSHHNSYLQASPSHHENTFDCHSSRNIFSEFFRLFDRRVVEEILVDDSVVLVYNTEFQRNKSHTGGRNKVSVISRAVS